MDETDPLLVSVKVASLKLSVSEATIRRRISRGDLPCVRIGSSVRIPSDSLREWIAENTQTNQRCVEADLPVRRVFPAKTNQSDLNRRLDELLRSKVHR